jgi:hypothetical protein
MVQMVPLSNRIRRYKIEREKLPFEAPSPTPLCQDSGHNEANKFGMESSVNLLHRPPPLPAGFSTQGTKDPV